MDLEEKRDRLYRVASGDPDPARRAKARELLGTLPTKTAATNDRPERHDFGGAAPDTTLQPGQDVNSFSKNRAEEGIGTAIVQGAKDVNADPEVARMASEVPRRLLNGFSMGASDAMADISDSIRQSPLTQDFMARVGIPISGDTGDTSAQGRRQMAQDHPVAYGAAEGVGSFLPQSAPTRIAKTIESGLGSLAASSPRVRALLGMPVAGGAVRGAVTGSGVGALQGGVNARGGPAEMLSGMAEGGESGAKLGAGFGAAGDIAGAGARALRDPDIALLEKYGMEPNPVPGRPVREAGGSFTGPPPLGTNKAGPKSRAEASQRAAEPIVNDLAAREAVNRNEIGRVRAENEKTFAEPSIYSQEMTLPLVLARRNAGLSPAASSHLDTLETRVRQNSTPGPIDDLPLPPRAKITPPAAQEIRMLADDYAGQNKAGKLKSAEAQMRGISKEMQALQPPEIRAQDTSYSTAQRGIERSKGALGLNRKNPIPTQEENPEATIKAARTVRQSPEDTATAPTATRRLQALRKNGPPPVMQDSPPEFTSTVGPGPLRYKSQAVAPTPIDYTSLLDLPGLHAAQENLQLNPSAIFSGAGKHGLLHRAGGALAKRAVYPALKGAANGTVGPPVASIRDLVQLLRLRASMGEDQDQSVDGAPPQ